MLCFHFYLFPGILVLAASFVVIVNPWLFSSLLCGLYVFCFFPVVS